MAPPHGSSNRGRRHPENRGAGVWNSPTRSRTGPASCNCWNTGSTTFTSRSVTPLAHRARWNSSMRSIKCSSAAVSDPRRPWWASAAAVSTPTALRPRTPNVWRAFMAMRPCAISRVGLVARAEARAARATGLNCSASTASQTKRRHWPSPATRSTNSPR